MSNCCFFSFIDAEPALTSSNVTAEEVLQETSTQPSTPEESELSKSEVLGPPKVTADTENSDKNFCNVFVDFKELGDESLTQEVIFPCLEDVKSEQGQTETDVTYMQPDYSECSVNEKLMQSKGTQTKKRRKVLKRQNGSMKQTGQAALPDGDSSAKSQSGRAVSPVCGKSSKLKKQVKTHKTNEESSFQGAQNKRFACDVCGKKFKNPNCLQIHSKLHTGIREFKCKDCGKSFVQKEHLVVHSRTHSGERPYSCDTCGKLFYTRGHLKTHMKRLSGEKPTYVCDICGQIFCQRGQLVQHQEAHAAEGIK